MTGRTYPRDVWVLRPNFKPVRVTAVQPYSSFTSRDYGDVTESGKAFRVDEMFDTKAAAIAHGRSECERQQKDLDKKLENLRKRRAALELSEKS